MLPTPFAITGKINMNWKEHKKKLLEDPEFKKECKVLPRPPGAKKLTVRDDYRVRVEDYQILYRVGRVFHCIFRGIQCQLELKWEE